MLAQILYSLYSSYFSQHNLLDESDLTENGETYVDKKIMQLNYCQQEDDDGTNIAMSHYSIIFNIVIGN